MHLRNMEREPHYVIFNIAPLRSTKERQSVPEKKNLLEAAHLTGQTTKPQAQRGLRLWI